MTSTYRPVFDCSIHWLESLRVKPDVTGAVDHAIVLDGLGELWERLWSVLRENAFDLAHVDCLCIQMRDEIQALESKFWTIQSGSRKHAKVAAPLADIHQQRLPSARYRAGAESRP